MIILKKGRSEDCVTPIYGFERHSSLGILGITFEMTSRFLKNTQDCSSKTIDEFKDWSESNSLPLNEGKCKEMIILEKGRSEDCVTPIYGFERHSSLGILG